MAIVKEDMRDIVDHNMNLVVHMFTHNDMNRHKDVFFHSDVVQGFAKIPFNYSLSYLFTPVSPCLARRNKP